MNMNGYICDISCDVITEHQKNAMSINSSTNSLLTNNCMIDTKVINNPIKEIIIEQVK
jgi:hypothetical protein